MKKYRNEDFEFTARDVSFFDTAEEQWNRDQRGALIEDVKSGSWAELGSLYTGDLILEVEGQPVEDVEALRRHRTDRVEKECCGNESRVDSHFVSGAGTELEKLITKERDLCITHQPSPCGRRFVIVVAGRAVTG
jgi:hypothetical protein